MYTERQLFLNHVGQTSATPLLLEIVKAEGLYLFDKEGKRYTDLISGISVSNIGHRHPKVVAAIRRQTDRYMHVMVYGEYVQSPQVQLADLLVHNLPPHLNCVYFVNSGTEATEGAMKLAKRYTGRTEIVSFRNSYHGSTQGALSVMGDEEYKNAFRPLLPGITQLDYNNIEQLESITNQTACVIAEVVQAEAGVNIPDKSFLQALRQRCNNTGTLLVFDEIQTGMGRTGSLFAFEQWGIAPDVLLTAKAFGGGLPLGAFISSQDIMWSLTEKPILGHITTFGGNPVCCAAGLASLQVLIEEDWMKHVRVKEQLFLTLLRAPGIKAVRSAGLLIAVEFDSFETNKRVIDLCIKCGLIVDWFLFAPHCLRLAPPLTIDEREIHNVCGIIIDVIKKVTAENV